MNRVFNIVSHQTPIYGVYMAPEDVRGVVLLVHGFGEHSGRYLDSLVPFLQKQSLAVLMYDNFGHGHSGGKRGQCPGYPALLELLEKMLDRAHMEQPGMPLFLYGHSMGGNLVLNRVLNNARGVKGVIASSPYLRLAFKPPAWKMVFGKVMLRIMPSITLDSGIDPGGISRIPEEVARYVEDPLVHSRVSPGYSLPVIAAGEWAIANAGRLQTDTLLLHGTADPIIAFSGTADFHRNAPCSLLQAFEGGYHELHHDLCREQVFFCLEDWFKNQLHDEGHPTGEVP